MPRWSVLALLLVGCNRYDVFRVSGYEQDAFTNDADLLFVVDNSASMVEESAELALHFDAFIEQLDANQGDADGLPDAVDNYIDFAGRRTTFVDYNIGITSTDAGDQRGGLFGPLIQFGADDAVQSFRDQVFCEATCFPSSSSLPTDPNYTCGDPYLQLSSTYLDCACGEDAWVGNCGSGNEEGLEAVFMALCRAVDVPPAECFDPVNGFQSTDLLTNDGLLRDNSTFIPVIISDEGDNSRRLSGANPVPEEYEALFRRFGHRMSWAVIGAQEGVCNGSTPVPGWSVARYEWVVDSTEGLWVPIATETENGCEVADFETALTRLGELLNRLTTVFPLQAIPDPDTIVVFVDGELVEEAEATVDENNLITWGDGWSYDPQANTVSFHGDAVPGYRAEVLIYYEPVTGQPRDLPF